MRPRRPQSMVREGNNFALFLYQSLLVSFCEQLQNNKCNIYYLREPVIRMIDFSPNFRQICVHAHFHLKSCLLNINSNMIGEIL
jgi:hypothetical protein